MKYYFFIAFSSCWENAYAAFGKLLLVYAVVFQVSVTNGFSCCSRRSDALVVLDPIEPLSKFTSLWRFWQKFASVLLRLY